MQPGGGGGGGWSKQLTWKQGWRGLVGHSDKRSVAES